MTALKTSEGVSRVFSPRSLQFPLPEGNHRSSLSYELAALPGSLCYPCRGNLFDHSADVFYEAPRRSFAPSVLPAHTDRRHSSGLIQPPSAEMLFFRSDEFEFGRRDDPASDDRLEAIDEWQLVCPPILLSVAGC
jgi:hypothetical protein